MIRIGLVGANGRMGYELMQALIGHDKYRLSAIGLRSRHEWLLNIKNGLEDKLSHIVSKLATDNLDDICKYSDIVIDFTAPEYTVQVSECAAKYQTPLFTGTTGFNDQQAILLNQHAKDNKILSIQNTSMGVFLLNKCLQTMVPYIGSDFDIDIIEKHHRWKKDSPSGTAKLLANTIVASNSAIEIESKNIMAGKPRQNNVTTIRFSSIRAGNISGSHTISFENQNESIQLSHTAHNRQVFAQGALFFVGKLLKIKEPGLYSWSDIVF